MSCSFESFRLRRGLLKALMAVMQWSSISLLSYAQTSDQLSMLQNFSSEQQQSVIEVCPAVAEAFVANLSLKMRFPHSAAANGRSSDGLVTFIKDRPGNDRHYAMDCNKIERELGYRAQVNLEAGLRTLEWVFGQRAMVAWGHRRQLSGVGGEAVHDLIVALTGRRPQRR